MGLGATTVRLWDSVQNGSTKRGGRCIIKTTTTRDATRIKRGIGNISVRRVQLNQGHGRKDKDPTPEVPGLCYGWWDTVQKHTTPSRQWRRRVMEDVRPKVASGNSVEGKPRRTVCGTRRKPEDNCTVGSPICDMWFKMQRPGRCWPKWRRNHGPRYAQTSSDPYQDLRTGTKCC